MNINEIKTESNIDNKLILIGDLNIERPSKYNRIYRRCFANLNLIKQDLKTHTYEKQNFKTSPDEINSNFSLNTLVYDSGYEHKYVGFTIQDNINHNNELIIKENKLNKFKFSKEKIRNYIISYKDDIIDQLNNIDYKNNINKTLKKIFLSCKISSKTSDKFNSIENNISEKIKRFKNLKINYNINSNSNELYLKIKDSLNDMPKDISNKDIKKDEFNTFCSENFFESHYESCEINFNDFNHRFTVKDIQKAISKLKNNKARDIQNNINEMLKIKDDNFYIIIRKIINYNIKSNLDNLREIKLIGIPKPDGGLRPICIGNIFKGLIDEIILDKLYNYCDKNKIICKQQIGFMKNKSSYDHVFILENKIRRTKCFIATFIDLKKLIIVLRDIYCMIN